MKKFVTITVFALIATFSLGACDFMAKNDGSTALNVEDYTAQEDTSTETLNACDVVDKSVIEAALGTSVQDPKTSGVTNIGIKGETCYYSFMPDDTVTNSFYVDILQFESEAEANDLQAVSGVEGGEDLSSSFGTYAKYKSSASPYDDSMEHVMYLQNGARVTKLIIAQTADRVSFSEDSARDALDQIVKEAQLTF